MKTQTGKLIDGFEYQGKKHTDFVMEAVTSAGDLFDAEIESNGVENQLAFNGALMARQLVRIGDCEGPFTIEQIRVLSPADFQALRIAQGKLNVAQTSDEKDDDNTGIK